jgi:hypothetical protein
MPTTTYPPTPVDDHNEAQTLWYAPTTTDVIGIGSNVVCQGEAEAPHPLHCALTLPVLSQDGGSAAGRSIGKG